MKFQNIQIKFTDFLINFQGLRHKYMVLHLFSLEYVQIQEIVDYLSIFFQAYDTENRNNKIIRYWP